MNEDIRKKLLEAMKVLGIAPDAINDPKAISRVAIQTGLPGDFIGKELTAMRDQKLADVFSEIKTGAQMHLGITPQVAGISDPSRFKAVMQKLIGDKSEQSASPNPKEYERETMNLKY